MKSIRNSKGFTLIELMIVVVIIGILAAIAIPKFSNVSKTAKQAEAGPVLKQICSLAEAEFLKENTWPGTLSETAIPGWIAPTKSRFSFTVTGGGAAATVATATPDAANGGAGLGAQTMNCDTKELSAPGAGA